ncbi:MAG: zinc metallopeptidase [Anaerolinea sp.]|nr:zinc metallopeptidase [Anaerolinea sp.]
MIGFGGYGLYFLFALPALLLGFWAQMKVQSAFKKYSQVRTYANFSGAQVARYMLDQNGLQSVKVETTNGTLSDHYDPRSRTLRLSRDVHNGNSVAAAGIAAHEAGHAIQHGENYAPLKLRSTLVPTVQIGSWLGPIIFAIGMLLGTAGDSVAWIGLFLFGLTAVFAVITLPVELDASRRAKEWLSTSGVIYNSEVSGVSSVLDAAAWTYVAAAIQAISTVLYYAFILLGRRRD